MPEPSAVGANLTELLRDPCTLSSLPLGWQSVVVERYHRPQAGETGAIPALADHWITLYLGNPITLTQRRDRQRHRGPLVRGDLTVTAAGHESAWAWDSPSDQLHLGLTPAFVRRVAGEMGFPGAESADLRNVFCAPDGQAARLGRVLFAELTAPTPGSAFIAEHLAIALTAHLLSRYGTADKSEPPLVTRAGERSGGLSPADLRRVVAFLHENLTTHVTLSDLAAEVGLSSFYVSRRFKASTGKTLRDYLAEARVERARQLLTSGTYTVAAAATEAGFFDQSHLARHCRRILGVTPRDLLPQPRKIVL